MRLYIITQLTGAALHITQDDDAREHLLTLMFLSIDESMIALAG